MLDLLGGAGTDAVRGGLTDRGFDDSESGCAAPVAHRPGQSGLFWRQVLGNRHPNTLIALTVTIRYPRELVRRPLMLWV